MAVSPASSTASAPSSTACAASVTSARVGRGDDRIDSRTWVATVTGTARSRAAVISRFCTAGMTSRGISIPRSPLATIRPSDTSRISSSRSTASGFSILAISGSSGRAGGSGGVPDKTHVIGALHEADRDDVDPHRNAGDEVVLVLVGHGRRLHDHTRNVDALVRIQPAAGDDLRVKPLGIRRDDLELDAAFINQQSRAPIDGLEQRRERRGHAAGHGRSGIVSFELNRQRLARHEIHRPAERTDSDLRTRKVLQNGDRPVGRGGRVPNSTTYLCMLVTGAVREVEPECVRTGVDERPQLLRAIAGGPDGTDDARAPHVERMARHLALLHFRNVTDEDGDLADFGERWRHSVSIRG